jgi:hypothetical protein
MDRFEQVHQRHHDDGHLDPQRLFQELAPLVDSEQIADHRGEAAEHEQAELDVGQLRAVQLGLGLLRDEVVAGAEEAHQQPHDQRVGVDHADDVEGQQFRQGVGQDIDQSAQRPDQDLHDEQEQGAGEIDVGDLLGFVSHDGVLLSRPCWAASSGY